MDDSSHVSLTAPTAMAPKSPAVAPDPAISAAPRSVGQIGSDRGVAPNLALARGPSPSAVLALQRSAGNRCVTQLLRRARPGGAYEIDATTLKRAAAVARAPTRSATEESSKGRVDAPVAGINRLGFIDH